MTRIPPDGMESASLLKNENGGETGQSSQTSSGPIS